GADDAGIEGDGGENDAGAAAGVGGDGEVNQVESTEPGKACGERDGEDFYDAAREGKCSEHTEREAANEVELESDEGKVDGDEEGEGNFADGVESFGEELAFFVHDRKAGQEGGEDDADVEQAGEDAVGEENGDGVSDGGILREKIEARFVDALYDARQEREAEGEENDCGDEVVGHLTRV